VLIADPTSLTADTVNFATVTITSPDASIVNTENVRVGLWVGSADPAASTPISIASNTVAADPIRPYAYAAFGGSIRVYNIYTGDLVATIASVASTSVGNMTVSYDGSTLYAVDTTNNNIVPVNLDTRVVGAGFSFGSFGINVIDYTRTNGVELIISGGGGQFFNAQTGVPYAPTFGGGVIVSASRNGSRFCGLDTGFSPYTLSCRSLDFTSFNGDQLLVGNASSTFGPGSNGQDVALSLDGTHVYVASGAPYEFDQFSTQPLQFQQALVSGSIPFPVNIEVGPDGRILGGTTNALSDPADVYVYDANGGSLTSRKVAVPFSQLAARQLKISGDGMRLIAISGDAVNTGSSLIFTNVGP
jgi:hypothetical protein